MAAEPLAHTGSVEAPKSVGRGDPAQAPCSMQEHFEVVRSTRYGQACMGDTFADLLQRNADARPPSFLEPCKEGNWLVAPHSHCCCAVPFIALPCTQTLAEQPTCPKKEATKAHPRTPLGIQLHKRPRGSFRCTQAPSHPRWPTKGARWQPFLQGQ